MALSIAVGMRSLFLLSLTSITSAALTIPSPLPNGYTSKGCYAEGTSGRALISASYSDGSLMTIESCINFCSGKGYKYAGTEYSSECYCGNVFSNGAVPAQTGDCSMACSGNANEPCGGPNRLNIFDSGAAAPSGPVVNPGPPGWMSLGCYVDAQGRTLPMGVGVPGGGNAMTVALCTNACQGYTYAGTEYSGECYCGNSFQNGGAPAANQADCSMTCNGNGSEYCGGPNRLNMYTVNGAGTTTSTPVSTSSTLTVRGTGTASQLPAGWSYGGCYVDGVKGRILSTQLPDSNTLTIESCVTACIGQGLSIAGVEYSSQCFCGNGISNGGVLASADTECNTPCSGNNGEMCGGGGRLSVYSNGPVTVIQPPAAQKSGLPGSWVYQGCITEGPNARVFKYQIINTNNNTATACLNQCAAYGYAAGGLEYGDECWCGDASNIPVVGSTVAPETDCNVPCSGDSQHYCGGGSRLSWYAWAGATPLYSWSYPTGNAAGQYQQFIGGVCIPLLTTVGVNGKVTFVEKYGTGEPNSTGAYELDPSQVNNLALAWRPMHVKTDVFCSASITLPDKVGRQINIGGWSGDSTFGIRIYWPDGSPGVLGKNDWQENVAEVSLRVGRWYPSAMVMTNGSILVVGGETGSNGPAVPSLELLPFPAGGAVITQDFLQRTNPFNLYPFLAVLPSGGILILYYNEGRILDPATFAVTSTLPNMPGAVNDFDGGRTYPLEGTAVLWPMTAPFTAPLTVMVCGGSTPGPGVAIDNCITTQPEVTSAQWIIERMPSPRVMSCIATLPDGTFLILNGAQAGVAGFGLGNDPNLNAVLYDPSKPVNSRMSVMANTTVARLYHSEAVVMQDGSVLVSGSDPQDGKNPEEYRVEKFLPPYLLSGLKTPSFKITNMDWTYGASISITVALYSGTTSTMRISLLGAESSTHGNSMGQRILFPAFTCAGNTCVITAPPNGNIAPPGWFQLFVLDGPTPSVSTWVRIGGDPGQLGNWPAFPDFNTPGV